jgi:hypothetical protein
MKWEAWLWGANFVTVFAGALSLVQGKRRWCCWCSSCDLEKKFFVLLITFHALHDYECCRKKMTQYTVVMECLEYDLRDIIGVIRVFFSAISRFLFFFLGLRVHVYFDYFVGTVSVSRRPLSIGCLVLEKGFYLANHIPYVPWLSTVQRKWSNIGSHGVPGIWSGRYRWCNKGSLDIGVRRSEVVHVMRYVGAPLKSNIPEGWVTIVRHTGCTVSTGLGSRTSFRLEKNVWWGLRVYW